MYHAQRRRAAGAIGLLLALLLGLPALLAVLPWLGTVRLLGIPLTWLVLGVVPFPVMVLLAWRQLRHAENAE